MRGTDSQLSYHVLVLTAAQLENIDSWVAKNQWKKTGRSPRQSHLLLELSERAPVEVTIGVVQVVTVRNTTLNKHTGTGGGIRKCRNGS